MTTPAGGGHQRDRQPRRAQPARGRSCARCLTRRRARSCTSRCRRASSRCSERGACRLLPAGASMSARRSELRRLNERRADRPRASSTTCPEHPRRRRAAPRVGASATAGRAARASRVARPPISRPQRSPARLRACGRRRRAPRRRRRGRRSERESSSRSRSCGASRPPSSDVADGPARTCQLATVVAPFQLASTVSRPPAPAGCAAIAGSGRRLRAPRREVGAEVLHVRAERGVEEDVAGGVVLGEVRQPAVAHQPVAARQAQQVALARGEQRLVSGW